MAGGVGASGTGADDGDVLAGESEKATQNHGYMGAKYPPVGVTFIDDEVSEAAEHAGPLVGVVEDGCVQHVGVGDDDVGMFPDGAALFGGGVGVVGGDHDVVEGGDAVGEFGEPGTLILGKGFGWGNIDRRHCCCGVGQCGEDWELVAEGFPAGGGSCHDGVLVVVDRFRGGCLVAPGLVDAVFLEVLDQWWVCPHWPGLVLGGLCWGGVEVAEVGVGEVWFEVVDEFFAEAGWLGGHGGRDCTCWGWNGASTGLDFVKKNI